MRVIFLVFLITLAGLTFANDARIGATPPDQRLLLGLDDDERNFLLHEMRGLLSAAQSILDATIADDRPRVVASARAAGVGPQGAAQHIPPRLREKLPEAFRKLGLGTHQVFDEIASDAEAGASRDALQRKLAEAMQRCVACHAAYGLRSSR